MSLTRKMLKAMSIEENVIDQIIEAHTETLESIKAERDSYKVEAEKVKDLENRLNTDDWEAKYNTLKEKYDAFKNDVKTKDLKARKESAYTELLKEIGISDKRIKSVLKVSDLNSIELGDDGKLKESENLKSILKEEWSDFIVNEEEHGADTSNPPDNNNGSNFNEMSLSEKMEFANANPDSTEVLDWLNKF